MVERHLAKVNVASSNLVFRSRKKTILTNSLFSIKSVLTDGINLLTQTKSLCDEIAFGGQKTDLISSKPQGFDFIQACLDFIVLSTISLSQIAKKHRMSKDIRHFISIDSKSLDKLLNFSSFTHSITQIIKLSSANFTFS